MSMRLLWLCVLLASAEAFGAQLEVVLANSKTCASLSDCAGLGYCSPNRHKCTDFKAVDTYCNSIQTCASKLTCLAGVCVVPATLPYHTEKAWAQAAVASAVQYYEEHGVEGLERVVTEVMAGEEQENREMTVSNLDTNRMMYWNVDRVSETWNTYHLNFVGGENIAYAEVTAEGKWETGVTLMNYETPTARIVHVQKWLVRADQYVFTAFFGTSAYVAPKKTHVQHTFEEAKSLVKEAIGFYEENGLDATVKKIDVEKGLQDRELYLFIHRIVNGTYTEVAHAVVNNGAVWNPGDPLKRDAFGVPFPYLDPSLDFTGGGEANYSTVFKIFSEDFAILAKTSYIEKVGSLQFGSGFYHY